MLGRTLIPAILLVTAGALPAQVPNPDPAPELPYDRGYDKDTPKHEAIDAQEQPETRALNNNEAAAAAASTAVETADADAAAAAQAYYQADLDAYRAAVRAHARAATRDQARYDRQQHAYADAMRQWRMQTYLCNKGKLSACKLPTPNPADFY